MVRSRAGTRRLDIRRSRARRVGGIVSSQRRALLDADDGDRPRPPVSGPLMLRALNVPISWSELVTRTYREVIADHCLGLAAQLAYYFFLALFPALLFLVAIVSFVPIAGVLDAITQNLARIAPGEVLVIVRDQ